VALGFGRSRTTCQMTGVSKSRAAVAKMWENRSLPGDYF